MAKLEQRKKGKSPLVSVVDSGRDGRLTKLFNHYRRSPWVHPSSGLGALRSVNSQLDLVQWVIQSPDHIVQLTIVAFLQILSKQLTCDRIKDPNYHHTDLQFTVKAINKEDLKKIYYTERSYSSYSSALFNGINRCVVDAQNEWKRAHSN
eukprot:856934_1